MDKLPGEELIKAGIEQVGKEVYDDVRPPVQAASHALTTLMNAFNLLLAPLERAQLRSEAKTERLRQELARGFEEIPEERRVEPPLDVVGPALESLKYVEDETLQDMFVRLLVASMDKETQSATHRAFVKIIEELSPYDAWMLKNIAHEYGRFIIAVKFGEILFTERKTIGSHTSYVPFALLLTQRNFDRDSFLNSHYKAERSIDNLVRLKIINLKRISDSRIKELVLSYPHSGENDNLYFYWTEEHADFIRIISEAIEDGTWKIWGFEFDDVLEDFLETTEIELSAFGQDFCTTCIPKS